MSWIVLGEKNGKIALVSKKNVNGILPKGSFITVEKDGNKFVLRVDDSFQDQPYSPLPMIADMDLKPLKQDQKCQNIITAYRIKDIPERTDGLVDYIEPLLIGRKSNQEEVQSAMGDNKSGPRVFLATVYANQNQLLTDDNKKYLTANLPEDMFYHQMFICGKTGSGKTVSIKYLAQYFVEKLNGAVLAINVKDVDLLKMDKPSQTKNEQLLKEWSMLGEEAHGIENFVIYYPANTRIEPSFGVSQDMCEKITLNVGEIDPEALTGLLQGISDIGAQNLPDIFRYWQETTKKNKKEELTFNNFIKHFNKYSDILTFDTLNIREEKGEVTLHRSTYNNIQRNLASAAIFFDNKEAKSLHGRDILVKGQMSVINVAAQNGIQFGSVLLRQLLHEIVQEKSEQISNVPILIIIDEVHMFYNTESSREALGDLDTICRTGRSQKIGIIFSSQNPSDIPKGLSSVINSKIFFKSDASAAKVNGISISNEEMENLKKGFAAVTIHNLPHLKIVKFPLSYCGVFE